MQVVKNTVETNTSWFLINKDMVRNKLFRELTSSDLKIYLVIKSYVNFRTGESRPTIPTISAGSKLCESTVKRRIQSLVKMGVLEKFKYRRNNIYKILETIDIYDEGVLYAIAHFSYHPLLNKKIIDEIKKYDENKNYEYDKDLIHIHKLLKQDHTSSQIINRDIDKLSKHIRDLRNAI